MSEFKPGTITAETHYVVVCAVCRAELSSNGSLEYAALSFGRVGWGENALRGWMCGPCYRKFLGLRSRDASDTA